MTISLRNYVAITSAVAASGGVVQRELIGRLLSENPKTPVGTVLEFGSATAVGLFYGTASPEYLRALFYFGFISKSLSAPRRLSFVRHARAASPARVYGSTPVASLIAFQAITGGTLSLTIGAQTASLTGLNFAAATSLADVAVTLSAALNLAAGDQFTTATVTYDATAGAFNLVASSGETDAADISINADAAGSIAGSMGWSAGAVFSPATPAQTITEALETSTSVSNNFGSFAFVNDLTTDEIVEAATWNSARNVEFMYLPRVTAANAVALSAALIAMAGTALTLAPTATEYDEMVPMMILAATDYNRRAAVQNYMFQQFSLTPKVTTDALAAYYDALRVNYYGQTQTAGQQINFYQRGTLTGPQTSPVDQNTYANEIWLKDAASSAILALLLALPRIPANDEGRGQILAILQDPIDLALRNGTISVGKTLTTQQRLFITQLTGDADAFHQVQAIGYWIDCAIEPRVVNDITEYVAVYTLVYGKDDTVRKVEGSHILV